MLQRLVLVQGSDDAYSDPDPRAKVDLIQHNFTTHSHQVEPG